MLIEKMLYFKYIRGRLKWKKENGSILNKAFFDLAKFSWIIMWAKDGDKRNKRMTKHYKQRKEKIYGRILLCYLF